MVGARVAKVNKVNRVDTTELLTELPDCVLVLNGSGHVQWGNKAAERLFGRSMRDSIGFLALELVHPDDLELVLRSFESVQRKDVGTLIEVRAKTPSGWRLLEVVGTPIGWSDEQPAVLFSMRDLTERRRFEVARNKDATFRTVVQNSPDMTILLSRSGVVDAVSGALSRILGHDPEVIEGRQLVGFVLEEDQPIFLTSLYTASQGATASNPLRVRIRLTRHETGEPVPFEFAFVNLLDDPTVGGFVVSAHDITAQVAAERELHQSEQRFRRVFTQGPLGIVLTDFDHRIIDVNDVFCLLVGRPSGTVIGSAFPSFVHTDDLERVRAVALHLVEQPATTHKTEIRLGSSNQEVVVASVTASMIQDESSAPMHCLWVLEDITNRKMLEREFVAHANTAGKLLAKLDDSRGGDPRASRRDRNRLSNGTPPDSLREDRGITPGQCLSQVRRAQQVGGRRRVCPTQASRRGCSARPELTREASRYPPLRPRRGHRADGIPPGDRGVGQPGRRCAAPSSAQTSRVTWTAFSHATGVRGRRRDDPSDGHLHREDHDDLPRQRAARRRVARTRREHHQRHVALLRRAVGLPRSAISRPGGGRRGRPRAGC